MDKVYQVFVSSTFADLEEERRVVSNGLAKAGFIPAGMELFPAADVQQLEYIKRVIDRSDYYVIIVAGRYGSLADGEVSYTEKEYEYAVAQNIPVLAFLHHDPRQIPVGKSDADGSLKAKGEAFRSRLKASRIVDHWKDASDLNAKVLTAVVNAANLSPRAGWVRGDRAVDPTVLLELERLRTENAEFRKQLNLSEVTFPPGIAGPETTFEVHLMQRSERGGTEYSAAATYGAVFLAMYSTLLAAPDEGYLGPEIGQAIAEISGLPKPNADISYDVREEDTIKLRLQLEALELITVQSQYRPPPANANLFATGHTLMQWTVTEKGRRFASRRLAVRTDS